MLRPRAGIERVAERIVEIFGPQLLGAIAKLDAEEVSELADEARAIASCGGPRNRLGRLIVLFGGTEEERLKGRIEVLDRALRSVDAELQGLADAFVRNDVNAGPGRYAGRPLSIAGRKRRMDRLLELATRQDRLAFERKALRARLEGIRCGRDKAAVAAHEAGALPGEPA